MKSKKILIIVIIIIAVLAIAGTVFGYLFMATDTFKSDKELFSKYISQNVETFQKIMDLKTIEASKELKNEDKYESNIKLKMTYSEGGEISNPINNLTAKLDIQKDNENQYLYADGQILFADEEYLESELIKEQELYGIRFSDVAKQFITIKNDENLENVANDIGIDSIKLETLMDIIDGTTEATDEIITKDQINEIKARYLNTVTEAISNGTFGSLKKAMITYNNNTIKTNAYSVSLSSEQVENLLIQILNNLKTEEVILKNIQNEDSYKDIIDQQIKLISEEKEIPAVKVTVYEQDKKTIRTVIEIGLDKIIIENEEKNGEIISNIQLSDNSSEQANVYNIEIDKKNIDNEEEFDFTILIANEEESSISLSSKMQSESEKLKIETSISYKKGILTASAILENEVNKGSNFEKKQSLTQGNNVVLNDITEERRKSIINALKENVPIKFATRLNLLSEALGLKSQESDTNVPDQEISQVEINKFNAKFEFYTGNEVSAENVKTLLGIVKDNLGSFEITTNNNSQNEEINPNDIKYSIKLNIERNKTDEEGINQVLEKISDSKKYKVSINYKELNQLIDYITINEVEE